MSMLAGMLAGAAIGNMNAANAQTDAINEIEKESWRMRAQNDYEMRKQERAAAINEGVYKRTRADKIEDNEASREHDISKSILNNTARQENEKFKQGEANYRAEIRDKGYNARAAEQNKIAQQRVDKMGASAGGEDNKKDKAISALSKDINSTEDKIFKLKEKMTSTRNKDQIALYENEIDKLSFNLSDKLTKMDQITEGGNKRQPLNLNALLNKE